MDKDKLREILCDWKFGKTEHFVCVEACAWHKECDYVVASILELEGKDRKKLIDSMLNAQAEKERLAYRLGLENKDKEIVELKNNLSHKEQVINLQDKVNRQLEQDRDRLQSIVREQKEALQSIVDKIGVNHWAGKIARQALSQTECPCGDSVIERCKDCYYHPECFLQKVGCDGKFKPK